MSFWYVLKVRSGTEVEIFSLLEKLDGIRAFLPLERERVSLSKFEVTYRLKPLWPNYVFVDWSEISDVVGSPDWSGAWHDVVGITGVISIIGGDDPFSVEEGELSYWISRCDKDGAVTGLEELLEKLKRGYARGDSVRIEGGLFDGYRGICQWFDNGGVKIALHDSLAVIYVTTELAQVVLDDSFRTREEARRSRRRRLKGRPSENPSFRRTA